MRFITMPTTQRDNLENTPVETIVVDSHADEVRCDGGGGALGHPAVWYSFEGRPGVKCMYCGRYFVKKAAVGRTGVN